MNTEQQENTFEPVPDELIARAKAVDMRTLAKGYVQLSKISAKELEGPCPRCGGTDRFHVQATWFFCRHCHEDLGDSIEFMRWKHNYDFRTAVEKLTGDELPKAAKRIQPAEKRTKGSSDDYDYRSDSWQRKAKALADTEHCALMNDTAGAPGRDYLLGRKIEPHAWLAFKLGYSAAVSVPGTKGQQKAPAISMPWIVGGQLRGIRYRFLEKQGKHKQSAFFGSRFGSTLYGGHALETGIRSLSTLLIVEGELNAISCWQVARHSYLDVLSLGSESAKLTDTMIQVAQQYRSVILWLDQSKYVVNTMTTIPGAYGFQSRGGEDANDLLEGGKLGGVLSALRLRAAQNDHELEGLLWDLWDAANSWAGVDDGTAEVIEALASKLGRRQCKAGD